MNVYLVIIFLIFILTIVIVPIYNNIKHQSNYSGGLESQIYTNKVYEDSLGEEFKEFNSLDESFKLKNMEIFDKIVNKDIGINEKRKELRRFLYK